MASRQRRTWADIRNDLIQPDEDRVIYNETGIAIRLGERVRQTRLAAGLSQEEVAQRAGVHQQAVARFEDGDVEPTLRTALRLARAVGLDLAIDLIPPQAEPPAPLASTTTR